MEAGDEHDLPRAISGRHIPALDGVRALAILGVMAYHLHFAGGGYLGVDLFFVLSGFLITGLLLEEWSGTAQIRLRAFWARRARRLLPAMFLVVIAVLVYALLRIGAPPMPTTGFELNTMNREALSTILYYANWHIIYFDQALSPLQHTWSLAIEEQFYLVWPIVLVVLLKAWGSRWRRPGVVLCITGAVASALAMRALWRPGYAGMLRAYCGTDTRAFTLLTGAALAFVVSSRPQPGPRARRWLHVAGPVSAILLIGFWRFGGRVSGAHMFGGGYQVCAVLAAVLIADVRLFDQGPLGRLLSIRPLRWIGTISYGLYLWHVPIYYYLTRSTFALSGYGLDVACVGLSFLAATVSYYLVERPIRRWNVTARRLAPASP